MVNATTVTVAPEPAYSEQDVKATLDGCRLTYLYEPDRARLCERASRLVSGGALVACFQGAVDADTTLTGRSVLCDPSNRWARENVNRFFRQLPIDAVIPLVVRADDEPWRELGITCLREHHVSVPSAWLQPLVGAIDRHNVVCVRGVSDDTLLGEMLRRHQARTRVPALIAVPFTAPGEPMVRTPREAIRTMFSSAIDVLVIERFVIAKDYWLLGALPDA